MTAAAAILQRPPQDDAELYELVRVLWGITIPNTQVCPEHSTPFAAFADAFFARHPVVVWLSSRGFGGKSRTLACLAQTEAAVLGVDVNILGGSGAQSANVHDAMSAGWNAPLAPSQLVASEGRTETRLTNGARIRALLASQRSVRGPHPERLRLDEVDEMEEDILDASLGQPMPSELADANVVLSSTHQYPDATFTEVLKRAGERNWPVHTWCWRETSAKPDGWLSQTLIHRTRETVPDNMWKVEYDLQEPTVGARAIDTESVNTMFAGYAAERQGDDSPEVEHKTGVRLTGERYEFELPDERWGEYITGADWAQSEDWTVIATFRTDCHPWRLVAFSRTRRMPYPAMIDLFTKRLRRYPGLGIHDATGLGKVVSDYLEERVTNFIMTGRQRDDMLSEYISGVERGEMIAPMIVSAYTEHKYASDDDIYSRAQTKGHLPDTVCAFALAWHLRKRVGSGVGPALDLEHETESGMSPWRMD